MSRTTYAPALTGAQLAAGLNADFEKIFRGYIKFAEDYGYSPSANAATNTAALQAAVLNGGTIFVRKGIYDMNDTILLDSNTNLIFEPGTKLKKVASYCQVFLNRGALTAEYNTNITIDGLEILTNGNDPSSTLLFGCRAHMGFYCIKNLTITNFKLLDGINLTNAYCFHITRFENLYMDGIQLTHGKDGIDLYNGHHALIQNAILETRDDATALKTIDYPGVIVEIGDVHDITFRNITDRTASGQAVTGQFCRAMNCSWADWESGNMYLIGNLALNNGHLYQVQNCQTTAVEGTVAPTHTIGEVTGADGITWRYKNESTVYHADIYNIRFDQITQTKPRIFFAAELYMSTTYLMAVYPGTEALSKIYNVSVTNGNFVKSESSGFIGSCGNLTDLTLIGNLIDNAETIFSSADAVPEFANSTRIVMVGNILKNTTNFIFYTKAGEAIYLTTSGNVSENELAFGVAGSTLRINGTDLTLGANKRNNLTPEIGDMIKEASGTWIYKAAGWVNLAV